MVPKKLPVIIIITSIDNAKDSAGGERIYLNRGMNSLREDKKAGDGDVVFFPHYYYAP